MFRSRSLTFTAGLVSLAVLLASCGGNDDAPEPTMSPATTEMDDMDGMGDADDMDGMGDADDMDGMGDADDMDPMNDVNDSDEMDDADDMDDAMNEVDQTSDLVELAAWQTLEIVDVHGVSFRLGDYVGTPLLVEPFATWCSSCRAQLRSTQEAAAILGDEAAVVALSVETDLSPASVERYATDNGFDEIRFAVMSPELLAALVDAFGNSIANPPSTPKWVVDAGGMPGSLSTGSSSAESLVDQLRAAAA